MEHNRDGWDPALQNLLLHLRAERARVLAPRIVLRSSPAQREGCAARKTCTPGGLVDSDCPPDQTRAQKDLVSWLSPEPIVRAKASQGLDTKALFPFLTTDGTTWAVLAGQGVYLTSHDWEQRDSFDLFAGPLTLEAFFEHFFACAKKLDPLNGSYDHRGALLRRARKKK